MKSIYIKRANPPGKKIKYTPKGHDLKAESKAELQDYYRSRSGKSLGLSADKKLSAADKVLRAMDIVGNKFKMIQDFEKGDDKVTRAFKAVRKK